MKLFFLKGHKYVHTSSARNNFRRNIKLFKRFAPTSLVEFHNTSKSTVISIKVGFPERDWAYNN